MNMKASLDFFLKAFLTVTLSAGWSHFSRGHSISMLSWRRAIFLHLAYWKLFQCEPQLQPLTAKWGRQRINYVMFLLRASTVDFSLTTNSAADLFTASNYSASIYFLILLCWQVLWVGTVSAAIKLVSENTFNMLFYHIMQNAEKEQFQLFCEDCTELCSSHNSEHSGLHFIC